jgi:hypothetical protein
MTIACSVTMTIDGLFAAPAMDNSRNVTRAPVSSCAQHADATRALLVSEPS